MTDEEFKNELREMDDLYDALERYELRRTLVPAVIDKLHARDQGLTELDCIVILNVLHRWLRKPH